MFTVLSHDRKYDAVMCFTVVCHQPDQLILFACIVRQLPFHSLIINRCVTTVSLSPDPLASDVETCAELIKTGSRWSTVLSRHSNMSSF